MTSIIIGPVSHSLSSISSSINFMSEIHHAKTTKPSIGVIASLLLGPSLIYFCVYQGNTTLSFHVFVLFCKDLIQYLEACTYWKWFVDIITFLGTLHYTSLSTPHYLSDTYLSSQPKCLYLYINSLQQNCIFLTYAFPYVDMFHTWTICMMDNIVAWFPHVQ